MDLDFETIQKEFEKQIQEIMRVEGKTREQVMEELGDMENMDDLIEKTKGN